MVRCGRCLAAAGRACSGDPTHEPLVPARPAGINVPGARAFRELPVAQDISPVARNSRPPSTAETAAAVSSRKPIICAATKSPCAGGGSDLELGVIDRVGIIGG